MCFLLVYSLIPTCIPMSLIMWKLSLFGGIPWTAPTVARWLRFTLAAPNTPVCFLVPGLQCVKHTDLHPVTSGILTCISGESADVCRKSRWQSVSDTDPLWSRDTASGGHRPQTGVLRPEMTPEQASAPLPSADRGGNWSWIQISGELRADAEYPSLHL